MKLTKKRDGTVWRVHCNGRPTTLCITKGDPPKFGHQQVYDVFSEADDAFLFEAKGVGIAMGILQTIATECSL
jgi:hypothetical protein